MFIGKEGFKNEYMRYLKASYGRDLNECTTQEKYINLVNVVSELAADVRLETTERQKGKKKVYYFSMEFLMGRLLENYLINLEIRDVVKEAITDLGEDFDT
ncbi:MAG: glycogen phosphorylase, partial [Parasporobacterium sp.]|nr:glycogen phosphorylase [Parasporobacterium sp.]